MKLKEIADRLCVHLRRIENDPTLNPDVSPGGTGIHRFYGASARDGGRYVYVTYICYQGAFRLTKAEAERYLEALDKGFGDRHTKLPKIGGAA